MRECLGLLARVSPLVVVLVQVSVSISATPSSRTNTWGGQKSHLANEMTKVELIALVTANLVLDDYS